MDETTKIGITVIALIFLFIFICVHIRYKVCQGLFTQIEKLSYEPTNVQTFCSILEINLETFLDHIDLQKQYELFVESKTTNERNKVVKDALEIAMKIKSYQ